MAKEQNHQKTLDALEKKEHQKILDALEKENEARQQETELWKEKVQKQGKHLQQIRVQFMEEAEAFRQRNINLMKKDDFQDFLQNKKDLVKERDALLAKIRKHKRFANDFKSKYNKLKSNGISSKSSGISPNKEQQDKEELSLYTNQKLKATVKHLAKQVDKSQKKKNKSAKVIKEQKDQIKILEKCISLKDEELEFLLACRKTQKDEPCRKSIEIQTLPVLTTPCENLTSEIVETKCPPEENIPRNLAEKEFFLLTCAAVKIASGHMNVDELMNICPEALWKEASEQRVPFHQFHDWIEQKITRMYFQTCFKKSPKKNHNLESIFS